MLGGGIMVEQPIYYNGAVLITQTLAQFGSVTYPIDGIGSVRVEDPKRGGKIVAGIFLCLFGGIVLIGGKPGDSIDPISLGLLIIGWTVLVVAFGMPYRLIIRTASGDVQAYESSKQAELDGIKQAIERAARATRLRAAGVGSHESA
jgi:hypothetical protein